jgi:uncharacterized protein YkwD
LIFQFLGDCWFHLILFKQPLNNERFRAGLSLLRLNSKLIAAAQAHSNDMARHNRLSHTGSDGSLMVDRMRRYGYKYRWAGENIAYGQTSAQEISCYAAKSDIS